MQEAEEKEPGLRDYLAAVRRRRGPATLVAVAVFLLATIITLLWPTKYESSATILIEQQEIPQDMVRSTITSFADQRIQIISQQVMTTANLLRIINEYNLYPRLVQTRAREVVIEEMRDDISMDMISAEVVDPRSGRPTSATIAFTLAYRGSTPDQALKVTNELTSLFLQKNLESRTALASETSDFLSSEASRLNDEIRALEEELSKFKAENVDRLPELNQLNLSLLDRSERELKDVERQLRALVDRRIYLASEVARLSSNSELFTEAGERIYSPRDRLKYLESQLATLESLYSEKHPDVVRTRREISGLRSSLDELVDDGVTRNDELMALRAERETLVGSLSESHPDVRELDRKIAAAELRFTDGDGLENTDPSYLQLKTQLVAVRAEEQSLEKLRDELKGRVVEYERKLAETPLIERDYIALQLDLDNARAKYREVKAREMEAVLAENMETDRKGERLTMIEPPLPPEQPASPDRPLLILGALVLAIGSGIGTIALMESTDTTIRGRALLEELVAMPAIGLIPYISTQADQRRRRLRLLAGGTTAIAVVIGTAVLVHMLVVPLDVLWYATVRRLTLQTV